MKKIYLVLSMALVVMIALGLYQFVYSDNSRLKIISPVHNLRVGDSNRDKESVPVFLELLYTGPDPEVVAVVRNTAGTMGTECLLKSGEQSSCYHVLATIIGENRFRIQIEESSGNQITKQFSVFWNPYNPIEWVLYYLGARNLNNGFLLVAIAAIIFFAIKVMVKTKNFGQTLIVVWGGASFAAFYLLWGYLGSATIPFFLIVGLWTILSLWGYATFFYEKSAPKAPSAPVSVSRVSLSSGNSLAKRSRGDLSVVQGEVKED